MVAIKLLQDEMMTYFLISLFLFFNGIYNVNAASCSVTASTFESQFCIMKQEVEAVKQFNSRISNAEHELLTLKHTVQTETAELKDNQQILQNLQKNISQSLATGGNNSTENKLEKVLKMLTDLQNRLDHLEVKCKVCGSNTTGTVGHPCQAKPCKNGGKCLEMSRDFQCVCVTGFTGERCEFTDQCSSSPCKNGGSCTSNILGSVCHCPSGYTGPFCEIKLNECDSNPCTHGRCILQGTSHTCICDSGYSGPTCDVSNGSQTAMPTTPSHTTLKTTTKVPTTVTHPDPCADNSVCNEPSTCKANGDQDFICVCPETDKTRKDNCLVPYYYEQFGFCCAKNTCNNDKVEC